MHPLADPQLIAGLAGFEQVIPSSSTLDDIPATRQMLAGLTAAMAAEAPDIPGVVTSDHFAPGPDRAPVEYEVRRVKLTSGECQNAH